MSSDTDIRLVDLAIEEDLPLGDASAAWLDASASLTLNVVARESCLLCGTDYITAVFDRLHTLKFRGTPLPQIVLHHSDGTKLDAAAVVATISGSAQFLLAGERIVLNFLMRLSGLATHAEFLRSRFPPSVALLDTRKTTPGWRQAEKYAFAVAGLVNHRHSLSQAAMIKDNHLPLLRKDLPSRGPLDSVEFELDRADQLDQVLSCGPNALLLDNFSADQLVRVLPLIPKGIVVELSGNLDPDSFAELWKQLPGTLQQRIDYVSLGRVLQNAPWIDFGMDQDASKND